MEGSVYDIRHKTNLDLKVYVGSTNDFYQRKKDHKRDCNKPHRKSHNYGVYKYIRANGGWDNWQMTEIYYGSQFREVEIALLKEYFDECINKDMTGRTRAEWSSKKIKCPKCGKMSSRGHLSRHQKTEKCKNHSSTSSFTSSESESE